MTESGGTQFGLMLRRPGHGADDDGYTPVFLGPDFTEPVEGWRTRAGGDPRYGETDWSLSLPHSCGEWVIGHGTREDVLADALTMLAELDQAITALREGKAS